MRQSQQCMNAIRERSTMTRLPYYEWPLTLSTTKIHTDSSVVLVNDKLKLSIQKLLTNDVPLFFGIFDPHKMNQMLSVFVWTVTFYSTPPPLECDFICEQPLITFFLHFQSKIFDVLQIKARYNIYLLFTVSVLLKDDLLGICPLS